jgi:outer membrane protein TolC
VEGALSPSDWLTRSAENVAVAPGDAGAAVQRRADVKSAQERTEALRAAAREPYYRLIPTLSLQGQMRFTPAPLQTEKGVDESATATLTWTIFDAGARYADRRVRVAQAESQALDERLLKRSVESDVALALASLKAARDAYRIAETGVAAAQKNTEETEILYRNGLARAISLTDANAKFFDAEVSRESAKLSMEQAYLDLRFALGFSPLDGDVK